MIIVCLFDNCELFSNNAELRIGKSEKEIFYTKIWPNFDVFLQYFRDRFRKEMQSGCLIKG